MFSVVNEWNISGLWIYKDGFAQSNDRIDNVSSEMTSVQNKLDKAIDKAKAKLTV